MTSARLAALLTASHQGLNQCPSSPRMASISLDPLQCDNMRCTVSQSVICMWLAVRQSGTPNIH